MKILWNLTFMQHEPQPRHLLQFGPPSTNVDGTNEMIQGAEYEQGILEYAKRNQLQILFLLYCDLPSLQRQQVLIHSSIGNLFAQWSSSSSLFNYASSSVNPSCHFFLGVLRRCFSTNPNNRAKTNCIESPKRIGPCLGFDFGMEIMGSTYPRKLVWFLFGHGGWQRTKDDFCSLGSIQ